MDKQQALDALESLPPTTRVSVAQLKPDDVIVIESPVRLSQEQREAIKNTAEIVWPDHRIAVLDSGMTLRIVASTEAE